MSSKPTRLALQVKLFSKRRFAWPPWMTLMSSPLMLSLLMVSPKASSAQRAELIASRRVSEIAL
jgi:hypothetical protein